MAKRKLQCRIKYMEKCPWFGKEEVEAFVFENKWSDEDEWGLDTAYRLYDSDYGKGELISYQALTKIRELQNLGIEFYFK